MSHKTPYTQTKFYKDFMKSLREAPRASGKIILEELPLKFRRRLLSIRNHEKRYKKEVDLVLGLDKKVYIYKYYPWSYKEYIPTLVLQGWYDVNKAKKAYIKNFGPKALKHVRFILGREALEKGFSVGTSLYINNKWRPISGKKSLLGFSKTLFGKRLIDTMDSSTLSRKRKKFDKEITYYQNGFSGDYVSDKPIKESRLQALQKINTERKKNLYEQ